MKGYSDIGNTADVLKKKYENESTTTNSSLGKQIDKFIFLLVFTGYYLYSDAGVCCDLFQYTIGLNVAFYVGGRLCIGG
jgi:hypothetical protein